ncbi:MAG: SDR family oxidoreductase [bacterium]|nr:short-chain dehydrogenase [Deltaproteobacteria bacterium]MCP4908769.1 SDR family oxidoreductase [bacterium]
MDLQLSGKRAVVTGGSRGIGRAIAEVLAREGCDVVICARGEAALVETATEIAAASGRKITPAVADTSKAEDIEAMIDFVARTLGGIDILVNNAAAVGGRGKADTLLEGDDSILRSDLDTKVLGYVRTSRAAARHMVEQGWGRIIQISGLATRMAAGVSGGMRNAAVTNLSVVLANELGPHGITVNTLQPGLVETETFRARIEAAAQAQGVAVQALLDQFVGNNSIGRIVRASEIAEVAAFIASPLSGALTGESISVGGGSTNVYY